MIRVLSQLAQKAHSRVLGAFSGSVDPSVGKVRAVALSAMLLVSLVAVGGAMAQFTGTWEDDFEDESLSGWDPVGPDSHEISNLSVNGDHSMRVETTDLSPRIFWSDGPELNMTEGFEISATVRPNNIDGTNQIRYGIVDDDTNFGALIIHRESEDVTFLAADPNADPTGDSQINNAFDDEWINVEISSPSGEDVMRAKVWEHGTQEPSDPQMERNFSAVSGEFTIDLGGQENEFRELYLDDVRIEGTSEVPQSDQISLDVQRYMAHDTEQDYRVFATVNDTMGPGNTTVDVTDDASVSSGDTDVITVDETTQTLNATANRSVNERVLISATYQGEATSTNVTVANATLDNAQILPGTWRATAMISDDTIFFMIIVAMIMGVIGRYATAFAGLGMGQLAVAIGWWGGYVPEGIAMVSIMTCLFIGLNVAVNVDYTVMR